MIWFRVALIFSMLAVFVFALGEVAGILVKWTNGETQQSMELDPARNGTMVTYVFILMFLFFLLGCCVCGFIICILVWRNKFQMDHKLRHFFVVWIGVWVAALFGNMGISIYALVRNKDPQGQMGIMYEMFQKGALDSKFVASFERFQRENSCCGMYGPDDWIMVQLRSQPAGAGMGSQSMDYGFQQNPSGGKCHLIPPTIPPGCGQVMMKVVNAVLNQIAGLNMVLVVMAAAVGIIAWYCFFYWLEKEVIVIPEDEVSNIIVVEPEPSDTSQQSYYPPNLQSARYLRGGDYLPPGSYIRHGESIYPTSHIMRNGQSTYLGSHIPHHQSIYPTSHRSMFREQASSHRNRTIVISKASRRNSENRVRGPSRITRNDRERDPSRTRISSHDREPSRIRRNNDRERDPSRTRISRIDRERDPSSVRRSNGRERDPSRTRISRNDRERDPSRISRNERARESTRFSRYQPEPNRPSRNSHHTQHPDHSRLQNHRTRTHVLFRSHNFHPEDTDDSHGGGLGRSGHQSHHSR